MAPPSTVQSKNNKQPNNNNNGSPGKFVKPADLFKMRRNSTKNNTITLTPSNNSNSSNPGANISFHLHSSPIKGGGGLFNQPKPPVPCSPNFKKISAAHHVEPPSPLKCLSNLADPSPTKNLPTILKNPFDRPVKRKLNLSPKKPMKRSKQMLALDEDANLEAPRFRPFSSPIKTSNSGSGSATTDCSISDWTLKTKLKVRFNSFCKNWNEKPSTTHRRFQEDSLDSTDDFPISLEAVKNLATVYQYPYLPWLPLYPRVTELNYKKDANNFLKSPQITSIILDNWRESLDDLTNLLIEGRCRYFYLCSDTYNVLFKRTSSSDTLRAYITPFTFGMSTEFNKRQIDFEKPAGESSINLPKDIQQTTSGSSQSSRPRLDNSSSQERSAPSSIDSGHCSELEDDEDDAITRNADTSQIFGLWNLSDGDISVTSKPKGFVAEADNSTQSSSQVPLAIIEGIDNLLRFTKFLKTNKLYTISHMGKFAYIPPTLLAPNPFRFSTPQTPEVLISQNMMDRNKSPTKSGFYRLTKTKQSANSNSNQSNMAIGPASIEISGTVLPNLYKELHNLLTISNNEDHVCQSTQLESSAPFSKIQI